jgi:hypothetical protein
MELITVDAAGRHLHGFRYFFYGNMNLRYPAQDDSVVGRCEEPGILVARDPEPDTGEPRSGGWGPVRARIPFLVQGNVLSLSAPLEVFSDREALSYRFLLGRYGSTVSLGAHFAPPRCAKLLKRSRASSLEAGSLRQDCGKSRCEVQR